MYRYFEHHLSPDSSFAQRLMTEYLDNLTMTQVCTRIYHIYKSETAKVTINQDINVIASSEESSHSMLVDEDIINMELPKEQP